MFETLINHIKQNYKQENIDFFNKLCVNKKPSRENKISYDIILNNYYHEYIPNYNEFYILNTKLKDSFIEAILIILFNNFYNFNLREKKRLVIEFRKYLSYNITTFLQSNKKLSRKFGKKGYLQEKLLNFSKTILNDMYVNKYISNFMDVNIYIFNISSYNLVNNIDVYYSNKEIISKYKPTLFLEYKNNKFNAITHKSSELIKYSNNFGNILDNLFLKLYKNTDDVNKNIEKSKQQVDNEIVVEENKQQVDNEIVVEENKQQVDYEIIVEENKQIIEEKTLNKMKVKELRDYVTSIGINIKKKSKKTNKMIFKIKKELLNDIQNLDSIKII